MSRGPPTPQGIITLNADVSQRDIEVRKKNANAYAGVSTDIVKIYPFGENDLYHRILQGDILLAYRGSKGINSNSKKINVFASLNGMIVPSETSTEELQDSLVVVGISKIDYDARNPGTPQNGVSVAIRGVSRIPIVTDIRRTIYPGEYLVVCLPSPSSGPRTFPNFGNTIPNQKIMPLVKPLDQGFLGNIYSEISNVAYQSDQEYYRQPIYDTFKTTGDNRSYPFSRVVFKHRQSIIVEAVRIVEVLIKRGHLKYDGSINATDKLTDLIDKDIDKKKKDIHSFAKLIGLLPDSINSNKELPINNNELQKDVFYSVMWPHIPSDKKGIYEPNIMHEITSGGGSGFFEEKQRMQEKIELRKNNQMFAKMAKSCLYDKDSAMSQYKSKLGERIVGKVLEPVNPENQNPRADILTGSFASFF